MSTEVESFLEMAAWIFLVDLQLVSKVVNPITIIKKCVLLIDLITDGSI
jgi:hypothetical protein